MGEKIVVGPINQGLTNARTPFVIDNDSFPTLINAYQWRGRVKRKRGTSLLGRLTRYFNSSNPSYGSISTVNLVAGSKNLLTSFGLQSSGNIVPGSVTIVDSTASQTYTDANMDGTLQGNTGGSGTINYASGVITIVSGATDTISVIFRYSPVLPVMGIEDFVTDNIQFPGTIAFDTTYSYNISTASPYPIYDVSFYKNPSSGTYPGYIQKTNLTPTTWNGEDYQQFWTVNYQGSFWTTNGITSPFSLTNIGMQYNTITAVAIVAGGPPAIVTITTGTNHGLVIGDFVFINEVEGMTGINWQTGYVTAVPALNQITVEFPNATIAGAWSSGGIVQYLTNRSDTTKDCLRFYDGDPTNGNSTSPTLTGTHGWVNFAPPLSQDIFSITETPAKVYYLVGARMIVPYKDRLLFLGPVIQTSAAGSQIYLQDTIIYSQNGTPYYTVSYTNSPLPAVDNPTSPTNIYTPILVPTNQTATPSAYFEDSTGFGGFISAGIDKPINSIGANEDVLICGLNTVQAKVVYTGSDIVPFTFYIINSELGTSSTFSAVVMDDGVISRGSRGFIMSTQNQVSRIDLSIPDQVFEINLTNNGTERICSQRDFINEWIYFTYPSNQQSWIFPNQTLQFNYRDNSWAIFNEAYTTYGSFRKQTGFIWNTVGLVFPTWDSWNESWDSGESTLEQPIVLAGNQQGFVMIRDTGTAEGTSLEISDISSGTGIVTSPNHTLNEGDYIIISGALGTIGPSINDLIFSVSAPVTTDTFTLNPTLTTVGTYLGGGLIKRMYVPYIQTKQFPASWGMSRKTRLGVQQYLLTATAISQIQLLIFLSQNNQSPYNTGGIVPDISVNNSLIYSTVLYTCPESTNLGLTPANINLQMVTASQQQQIWHRINTSLIGDTVQVGFTLSDAQMRSFGLNSYAITGATQANPLVLTTPATFENNSSVTISGVVGMTQLNGNSYTVLSSTSTTLTLDVDSSAFDAYVAGGIVSQEAPINQFAEIELHGFILDVNPSLVLA